MPKITDWRDELRRILEPKIRDAYSSGVTVKDFPLYLSNNKRAILYVPATMTAKDYELLKRQIDNHMAIIEATSVAEDIGDSAIGAERQSN